MTDDAAVPCRGSATAIAAVVLSGGRGSRLGGISKASLVVDGVPLLDGVLDALEAGGIGAGRVTVVGEGPAAARAGLQVTREEPPFSGPLAALGAGLELVPREAAEVLVLACDLPRARHLVPLLLATDSRHGGAFGTVTIDADGRTQWLAARYRRAPLTAAVERIRVSRGTLEGAPLRAALGDLALASIDDAGTSVDIDTPEDLARERNWHSGREPGRGQR